MPDNSQPRRWVPFSPEMHEALEKLQIAYPRLPKTPLTSEALRRGMLGMLAEATVPTLPTQNVFELRRAG